MFFYSEFKSYNNSILERKKLKLLAIIKLHVVCRIFVLFLAVWTQVEIQRSLCQRHKSIPRKLCIKRFYGTLILNINIDVNIFYRK